MHYSVRDLQISYPEDCILGDYLSFGKDKTVAVVFIGLL